MSGGSWKCMVGCKLKKMAVPNELKKPKNNMCFCFFSHIWGVGFRSKCGIFHFFLTLPFVIMHYPISQCLQKALHYIYNIFKTKQTKEVFWKSKNWNDFFFNLNWYNRIVWREFLKNYLKLTRKLKPFTMWNCTSKVGKIGAPRTFLARTPSFIILGGSNFHHMFTTQWGMF